LPAVATKATYRGLCCLLENWLALDAAAAACCCCKPICIIIACRSFLQAGAALESCHVIVAAAVPLVSVAARCA
jgi:hypothetical protein